MRTIRRILAATAAAVVALTIIPATHANADDVTTWYVCKGTGSHPLQAWGSTSAPKVDHVPIGTQFRGYAFGAGTHMLISEGALKGKYSATANLCKTSSLGVGRQWQIRGNARYGRAKVLDDGKQRPDFYARMALTRALHAGWADRDARAYLDKALAAEIGTTGGFGIGSAWDAMADGTVNPADAAYTVTITEHIGQTVLSAYQSGVVGADLIERMIAKVQSIGTVSRDPDCIAYSDNVNDTAAGLCVYNINTSAGAFLLRAQRLGFDVDGDKAQRMISHSIVAHDSSRRQWRYASNGAKWNDSDHNAFQAVTLHDIHPTFARPIIAHMNSRTLDSRSGEAHTVLAQADCAGSRAWLSEHDSRFGGTHYNNADRQAYGALMAVLAAKTCG